MSGLSVSFMKAMLDGYDEFEGVERLVDVGGSVGDCFSMIMKKYPEVKEGVNFDLPEVVAHAPNIPDEECEATMKNCHKALPERGKLIMVEPVLLNLADESHRTRSLLGADIFVMTIYRTKGRHRKEEEYRQLGLSAGFPHFRSLSFDYY